ncbi:MAG: type II toxin-antitoxin system VapB family antitoxin [Spirulinaceae cyanobacterium]
MTQPTIDPQLLQEALALSDHLTPEELITTALRPQKSNIYIQRRQQRQIFELFGTIDYDPDYDYKQQRKMA